MFTVIMCIVCLAIFAAGYFYYSGSINTRVFSEAHKIKAVNYAKAGLEKAKLDIYNSYSMGIYDVSTESGKLIKNRAGSNEYKFEFPDGGYEIISIKAQTMMVPEKPGSSKMVEAPVADIERTSKGEPSGTYDIWIIETRGYTKRPSAKIKLRTLLKIYRDKNFF